jgi:hypothetical protein
MMCSHDERAEGSTGINPHLLAEALSLELASRTGSMLSARGSPFTNSSCSNITGTRRMSAPVLHIRALDACPAAERLRNYSCDGWALNTDEISALQRYKERAAMQMNNLFDQQPVPQPRATTRSSQHSHHQLHQLQHRQHQREHNATAEYSNEGQSSEGPATSKDEPTDDPRQAERIALLENWRCTARNYQWLHNKSCRLFNTRNLFYVVPIIALSSVAGSLSLTVGLSCDTSPVLRYMIGFMGLTTAALSTLHSTHNYGERAGMHKTSADGFHQLARSIAVESVIYDTRSRTYANLTEFIKECNERFNRLIEQAPPIPDSVMSKLQGHSSIATPPSPLTPTSPGWAARGMDLFRTAKRRSLDAVRQNGFYRGVSMICRPPAPPGGFQRNHDERALRGHHPRGFVHTAEMA